MAFKIPSVISTVPLLKAGKILLPTGAFITPVATSINENVGKVSALNRVQILERKVEESDNRAVKAEELAWQTVNDEKNKWGEQLELLYKENNELKSELIRTRSEKDMASKLWEEEKKKNLMMLNSAEMRVDVLDPSSSYSYLSGIQVQSL